MKNIFKFATILCTGLLFGACTDDIVVDNVDEGAYANVENLLPTWPFILPAHPAKA